MHARRDLRILTLAPFLAALALGASGCGSARLGSAPLSLRSGVGGAALTLTPTLAALERRDEQRMVIYLTDLPQHALSAPIDQLSGSIVRIERFFVPRPGRTPMDSDSVNAAIRWAVLARGAAGVYEGGGLALTGRSLLAGGSARGALRGATLRLAQATADFHDRLGAGAASGVFPLREDRELAQRLAELFARVSSQAQLLEIEPGEPAEPTKPPR